MSRICAEWINQGRVDFSLGHMFGDGELLVIATVIAAAGIGDLVFDLGRSRQQRGFKDSLAIASALFCVIISVLFVRFSYAEARAVDPSTAAGDSSD